MLSILSIGGNAIDERMRNLSYALSAVKELYKIGDLIITHGNGPQVGELAEVEHLSLSLLTAQTEAEIGYAIKREIKNSLGLESEVFLTDVLVRKKDPAFKNPTKPIGKYYTKEEAEKLEEKGLKFAEFEKGFRRVVPSPRPIKILNIESMKRSIKGKVLIAGGGGGIPLIKEGRKIEFVEAVIDKDYTTALIAKELGAKQMIILTNVDGAYINYGKPGEEMISEASTSEMRKYLKKGQFGDGSMKPKVEACIDFVEKSKGIAAIGNLSKARDVARFRNCTVIKNTMQSS
ncbi:MAG: carbamate kinase [Candidatus Micrarchaeia archaeon]